MLPNPISNACTLSALHCTALHCSRPYLLKSCHSSTPIEVLRRGENRLVVLVRKDELFAPVRDAVFPVLFIHGHAGSAKQAKHLAFALDHEEVQRPRDLKVLLAGLLATLLRSCFCLKEEST